MGAIKRFYDTVCKLEEAIAGICLVVILVLVFGAAVARSIGRPLVWAMDFATFLFAWTVFLSADAAMRHNRHVNIDLLINRLPEKARHLIILMNHVAIIVFLGFLIRYGITMSYLTRFRAFQGIPGFSYMWATLAVPVGSFLLLITTVLRTEQVLRRLRGRPASGTYSA